MFVFTIMRFAGQAGTSFTNPQQITIYVMDDDFGFKDNIQGYVTVELPTARTFIHEDINDIPLLEPAKGGSYKELELIKAGWLERKLKRKIAKSTGPGTLGTLSVSLTIFEASLLRKALRRESNLMQIVQSTKTATPETIALDALVKQAQKDLQKALLAQPFPTSGDTPQSDFASVADSIIAATQKQMDVLTSAEEEESKTAVATPDPVGNQKARTKLQEYRKFFLGLQQPSFIYGSVPIRLKY